MERDFKGVWIPKEIWLNKELSIVERALFAEIDSLDTDHRCIAGNDYFAEFFGVSESTITRAISHLKDLGLIESSFNGRIRTLRVVKMTTQSSQNDFRVVKMTTQSSQNDEAHINNNTENNIKHSTENTNKQQVLFNIKEELNKDKVDMSNIDMSNKVQHFINDYNSICVSLPKCSRVTVKRSKAIANILKKFTGEEILEVFNNLENSDFCKGKNDRGWRASIDFILNEEKFIYTLEGRYNSKRRCNAEVITPGEKYRVSAEEKEEMRKAVERGELKEY